jgi:peptide/nickel transport system substrate-binding protein
MGTKHRARHGPWRRVTLVATFAAIAAVAAVTASAGTQSPAASKLGGTITVLSAGDVDYIDPGITYYAFGYAVAYTTQRPLYSYKPTSVKPFPDLAAKMPTISKDGKTVTVPLKHGIRFSPPVGREVTSADVKYAIERAFTTSVANGYVGAYFNVIVGAPAKPTKAVPNITGIRTPNKYTLVFKLKHPSGTFAGALVMPATAPVPEEYAKPFDAKTTSDYGQHQVATGPYMIANDASGKLTGYQPGRLIELVRNPNWDRKTSFRPAYADTILFKQGYDDPTVMTKQILSGTADVNGDVPPPAAQLRAIVGNASQKAQLTFTPTGGSRYVALDTTKPPFDNLYVRQAVAYVLDRNAMRLTRGGAIDGTIATHFIDPSFKGAGWEYSGGYTFNPFPSKGFSGDVEKALSLMKKAGYPTGKYTGPQVTMVADNVPPGSNTAKVVAADLAKIGFNVKTISVTHSAMYTRFCNVPRNQPNICPNVGWLPDFHEPETLLNVTFNGQHIVPVNNSNWPQLNDPKLNAAMDKAAQMMNPTARYKAWAKIDQQVTKTAAAIPWLWENYPTLYSTKVTHASELWNEGFPDVTFMQVKS